MAILDLLFLLDENDLKRNILGVGDDPASFNAILTGSGGNPARSPIRG